MEIYLAHLYVHEYGFYFSICEILNHESLKSWALFAAQLDREQSNKIKIGLFVAD